MIRCSNSISAIPIHLLISIKPTQNVMARNSAAATAVTKAPIVPFGMVEDAAPMKTWVGVRTY